MIEMSGAVLREGDPTLAPGGLDFTRLAIEKVQLAPPEAGEVLVRVAFASLCHSDLSVLTGDRPRPLPMLLGHEASGVVVEVGGGVTSVAAGDHVVFTYVASCGRCDFCREGRPALCSAANDSNRTGELVGGGTRLHDGSGAAIHHHLGLSAFADYAVVNEHAVLPVAESVPLQHAALFGCAVNTGVGAVLNAGNVQLGQAAAVFGCGGVGLAAVLGLRAAGAAPIVAVDLNEGALALASILGADFTVFASADAADTVRELTSGGVDVAIEASGALPAIDAAYRSLRRGGRLVLVGLPNPALEWRVSPSALVANDITVRGSYLGSSVPTRDVSRFLALYQRGRLEVDRLVGETITLQDVPAAMPRLHAGGTGRIVVDLSAA